MLPAGGLFIPYFPPRPVVAKRTVAAAEKPSNGHGLQRLHRVRLPAWRSEKFNPFASCVENQQNKGFGRVSTGVEGQPNNQALWRETIMELTPFDRMGLLNMEDAD